MGETVLCSRCAGEIAGGAKKYRDKRGGVYCGPCAQELSRSKAKAAESDAYALADEPKPTSGRAESDLVSCRGCGGTMIKSDIICIKCGFNRATGGRAEATSPGVSAPQPTPKDRRRPKTVRDDILREARNAYIKSGVIIAVCLPIAVGIWAAMPGIELPVWFALATFGALYVVTLIAFFVSSLLWIGFDEPMELEALRLGAVCAITEIARALLSPLPMNWRVQAVAQLIVGFVFVVSLIHLMEMEKEDAIIFALLVWMIRVALAFALLYQAAQNGWI